MFNKYNCMVQCSKVGWTYSLHFSIIIITQIQTSSCEVRICQKDERGCFVFHGESLKFFELRTKCGQMFLNTIMG